MTPPGRDTHRDTRKTTGRILLVELDGLLAVKLEVLRLKLARAKGSATLQEAARVALEHGVDCDFGPRLARLGLGDPDVAESAPSKTA